MAIVNKNFRVKNGLIVDGSVATVNGYNVLTEASTAFIINTVGGSADSANNPNTVVKRDGSGNFAAGTITATFSGNLTGNVTGTVSSLSNHNTGALAEGSNLYFTNARALSATAAAYDAAGAASSAQANAATDATTKANAAQAAAAIDATTKANAAKAAAEATAAAALTAAIATEVANRNTAIGAAVDSLVDGAPALLNTLNELAAAINDDANYTTTITTALGTKANSADVTAAIATAKSEAATDASTKANAAKAAAEATAAAALTNAKNGTASFTTVNVNDVAAVKASTSNVASASTVNALTWAAADYRTAKAIVKLKNGVNTQVSEVLLTLDTNNNVAITEFGTISTDLELGTVTAAYASGNVSIAVTTTYASTDVMVYATLIK